MPSHQILRHATLHERELEGAIEVHSQQYRREVQTQSTLDSGIISTMKATTRSNKNWLWVLIALAAVSALAVGIFEYATHRGQTTTTAQSGIEGTVTYGPLCPLEPCSTKPTFDFDIVVLRQSGDEAGRTPVKPDGSYKLALSPGSYQIKTSRSFTSEMGGTPRTAQVAEGKFTRLDLSFDTGIR